MINYHLRSIHNAALGIVPAFPSNLPPSHPVLKVPPVVVGDFGHDGGDREEHKDGGDGHDHMEVVEDTLFVMRRKPFLQGGAILLKNENQLMFCSSGGLMMCQTHGIGGKCLHFVI